MYEYWSLRLHREVLRFHRRALKLQRLGLYLFSAFMFLVRVLLFFARHASTLPPIVWLALGVWIWMSVSPLRPFLRTSYAYVGDKSAPYYTKCTYLGLHGFEIVGGPTCPAFAMWDASGRTE